MGQIPTGDADELTLLVLSYRHNCNGIIEYRFPFDAQEVALRLQTRVMQTGERAPCHRGSSALGVGQTVGLVVLVLKYLDNPDSFAMDV